MKTAVTTLLYTVKIMYSISLTQPDNMKIFVIGLLYLYFTYMSHTHTECLFSFFFFFLKTICNLINMFAFIYKVMKFHIHFALNIYLHFQPSLQGTISSRSMMCIQYKILSLKKQWNGMYFLSSSSSFLYTNFPSSVFLLATPPNYS